jgi:hypothetical protein
MILRVFVSEHSYISHRGRLEEAGLKASPYSKAVPVCMGLDISE